MKTSLFLFAVVITACNWGFVSDNEPRQSVTNQSNSTQMNLHNFTVKDINGNDFALSQLKGKKVLIVNTASECGLTPQYKQLQELYEMYGSDKFTIIGFPANNFGGQEPGTDKEIAGFCEKNYGVTFPMMAKISVTGEDQHEVYQFLTQESKNGVEDVKMVWNFQKILIDENGHFVKSVHPRTSVLEDEVLNWIKG
ncbi:MAG: glutathione peroxidase [Flavobacteriales bacterium]